MFVVGLTVFNLNMRGNYLVLGLLVSLGAIMLFGIGLAVGGWAKNERQAAPLCSNHHLPYDVSFGELFPTVSHARMAAGDHELPAADTGYRCSTFIITENRGVFDLLPQFGIILGWCLVAYLIAFRVFRWE